jgi:mannose/cellobiose epimerase-like protein (N-acyl-D-glucosamine 2-epimerase family)
MTDLEAANSRAVRIRDQLMAWLIGEALPTWWAFGIDHGGGGFQERLGTRCDILVEPRRVRVIARQVYVFAAAGRLGWTGPWRTATELGVAHLIDRAVLPDGTVRLTLNPDGTPLDDSFSLYDQAFALFAFAAAVPVVADRAPIDAAAAALSRTLSSRYKHPVAGFEEAAPPTLPLKSNPHMHLLEAFLALEDAGVPGNWPALADEIAELGLSKFIDARTGFLREYFAADWTPAPGDDGRIVEPGHQFEWAWLLTRWGLSRRRPDALAAAARLAALGEKHGTDPARRVAVNEINDDGAPRDNVARLWPQTERIKAHVALAGIAASDDERATHLDRAAEAGETLARYLAVEAPGLWRDRMEPDGTFRIEPAPASTFYHIVCAIAELDRGLGEPGAART